MKFPLIRPLLFIVAFLSVGSLLQAQQFKDAVAYNDYVVEQQLEIQDKMVAFNEAIGNPELTMADIRPYHTALLAQCESAVKKIKAMPPYEGNTALRDNAKALYEFYTVIVREDFEKMMVIVTNPEASPEDYAVLESILNKVTESEKAYDEAYLGAQEAFAAKHNFKLVPQEEELEGE